MRTLPLVRVHLDVSHISQKTLDYISLGVFDAKNKPERVIPISAKLKPILRARIEGKGPADRVFLTNRGIHYDKCNITQRMKTTCRRANIPYGDKLTKKKGERTGIVFHSLRHTRGSQWVKAEFSDEIVRRASGHKNLDAYQKYIKLDPSTMMRLVEQEEDKNSIKTSQSLIN